MVRIDVDIILPMPSSVFTYTVLPVKGAPLSWLAKNINEAKDFAMKAKLLGANIANIRLS